MSTVQLTGSSPPTIFTRPHYRVSVKSTWVQDWQLVDYLEPLECVDCAATSVPRATFRWRAGTIKREDGSSFGVVTPLDLVDRYVQVEILPADGTSQPFAIWTGVFCEESFEAAGDDAGPQGDQTFTAFGLQHLLDRKCLQTSVVTSDGATAAFIDTLIPFNQNYQRGWAEIGNRSAGLFANAGRSSYVFADADPSGAQTAWGAADIAQYLLTWFSPSDLPFTLGGQTDAIANLILPKIEVRGKTVRQILDELIDRRRGLGWCVRIATPAAEVHVFTTLDVAVTLDEVTVPANPNQQDLAVDDYGQLVKDNRLQLDTLTRFSSIVVAGEPIVTCFTVAFADGTLEKAWTPAEETAYKTSAGGTGKVNDEGRAAEQFRHVFTTYRIPKGWGWKAGDGNGGAANNANPFPDVNGQLTDTGVKYGQPAPIRNWGQRLLRSIPLLKPFQLSGADPEYREAFALIQKPGYPASKPRYGYIEHVTDPADTPGHMRVLDKMFGFEVRMHPQHLLALNDWTNTGGASQHDAKYDYTTIAATVAARTDTRIAVFVSVDPGAAGPAADRMLYITVPEAELWYVVPGTILDLDPASGSFQPATEAALNALTGGTGGFVVRDDSDLLRQIAALAQAWYATPRASLTLSVHDIWVQFPVGSFINSVTDAWTFQPINSAVSEVSWNLERMQTSIRTSFGEMDFAATRRKRKTLR